MGGCISPNNSTAFPAIFMSHISELDDFFFLGLHLLHFIAVGKDLGNRAGVSNLLNHPPPQSRKMAKNG